MSQHHLAEIKMGLGGEHWSKTSAAEDALLAQIGSADEKRRAFRRAQRAGAHASATPQPAAPAERAAPAATQSPKQSALAFNALVLAQVRVS